MKILRMKLENYVGIKNAEFKLDGRSADFYGANAAGKTTICNAFTWLLFGRALEDINNFNPKSITGDDYAHNLNHSVECEMEINGQITTFKRVYHEVWKKVRGNPEANLSGHTTDYYIDGVPKQEKEYKRYWEGIFSNDELPKMLTMPFYFPETMHWEKRRAILLDIAGVISDSEIIETDEELKALPALLGNRTADEYKKVIKASLTEINRNIQAIPARIDEAEKAIPDTGGYNEGEIEVYLAEIHNKISASEKERAALLADNNTASKTRIKIAELEYEIAKARREYAKKEQTENNSAYEAVREIRDRLTAAENIQIEYEQRERRARNSLEGIESKRNDIFARHKKLQEQYNKVKAEVFDESALVCPTCGQDLPVEKEEKLRAEFNISRSDTLTSLSEQMNALVETGKKEASKEMMTAAEKAYADIVNLISDNDQAVELLKAELTEAVIKQKQNELPPFEQTVDYKTKTTAIEALKSDETKSAPDTSGIDNKIAEYRLEETALNKVKAAFETAEVQRSRIAELEKQEKELGKAYEEAQRSLYLCEKLTRIKSDLLTDKINGRFKSVSFRLFEKNITNEGINDICTVLVHEENGRRVPFKDANKAARINTGLEIIGVLSEHYGVELPLFIDNAESITDIIPVKSQLIRLIVSKPDKQLRLELL